MYYDWLLKLYLTKLIVEDRIFYIWEGYCMENSELFKYADITKTLKYVEIETFSGCTRKCVWCLHGSRTFQRPNNSYLDTKIIERVFRELYDMGFDGTIALYSINEPLMDERIKNGMLIELCKTIFYKRINCVLITNADLLNQSVVDRLFQAGLDKLSISCYSNQDYERASIYNNIGYNIQILDQRRFLKGEWESNRAGVISGKITKTEELCCYAPFFRIVIGWDGNIRICPHEMQGIINFGNIKSEKLIDILRKDEFKIFRTTLIDNRKSIYPCSGCNVEGGLKYSLEHLNMNSEAKNIIKYLKILDLELRRRINNDNTKVVN